MVTNKLTGKFLLTLPPVHVYKLLMNNNIVRFPNRFWVGEEALVRASKITIHLVEGVLKWHKTEVKEQMSIKIFRDNKLLGMLRHIPKNNQSVCQSILRHTVSACSPNSPL